MGPQDSVLCFPQVLACIPGEYGGTPSNPVEGAIPIIQGLWYPNLTQVIGGWSYTSASVNRDLGAIFQEGLGYLSILHIGCHKK